MAQHLFAAETAPIETNLDANFTELYNAVVNYSIKVTTWIDDSPTVMGANLFGNPGTVGNYRFGLGMNFSFDGTNYRAATDGSNSGAAAVLVDYASGTMEFYTVASAGASAQTIAPGSMPLKMTLDSSGNLAPGADNSQKLGGASKRWSTIYAGTGTINTSDAREKTEVIALTVAEIAAAQELVSNIGTYQWLSAVQAKGEGDARKHVGMTVQQAISVMTSHGLDPMAYGFICYDSWPAIAEKKDANGAVVVPASAAGDRYSFRPDELGMFIARGVAARLSAIEARLHALDGL